MGWNVAIAAVVVIGVVAMVLTRGGRQRLERRARPSSRPRERGESHWHTALGVNICGEWIPDLPTFELRGRGARQRERRHPHPRRRPDPHPSQSAPRSRATTRRSGSSPTTPASAVSDSTRSTRGPARSRSPRPDRRGATATRARSGSSRARRARSSGPSTARRAPATRPTTSWRTAQTIAIGIPPEGRRPGRSRPRRAQAFANISDQQAAVVSKNSPCRDRRDHHHHRAAAATETTTAPAESVKAVVLVGGEGTRLRPLTYATPKPLLPIANRAFLDRQLEWLAAHGVDEVVLSLGYLPDAFEAHFAARPAPTSRSGTDRGHPLRGRGRAARHRRRDPLRGRRPSTSG